MPNTNGSLDEKVAFGTGGARGIGRATALAFAPEGANVVVADTDHHGNQDTARMIEDLGGQEPPARRRTGTAAAARPRPARAGRGRTRPRSALIHARAGDQPSQVASGRRHHATDRPVCRRNE
jgi:NAD(P)-dependent dehydrogenase (short-subunit alcohol dehydrogenase family)